MISSVCCRVVYHTWDSRPCISRTTHPRETHCLLFSFLASTIKNYQALWWNCKNAVHSWLWWIEWLKAKEMWGLRVTGLELGTGGWKHTSQKPHLLLLSKPGGEKSLSQDPVTAAAHNTRPEARGPRNILRASQVLSSQKKLRLYSKPNLYDCRWTHWFHTMHIAYTIQGLSYYYYVSTKRQGPYSFQKESNNAAVQHIGFIARGWQWECHHSLNWWYNSNQYNSNHKFWPLSKFRFRFFSLVLCPVAAAPCLLSA